MEFQYRIILLKWKFDGEGTFKELFEIVRYVNVKGKVVNVLSLGQLLAK